MYVRMRASEAVCMRTCEIQIVNRINSEKCAWISDYAISGNKYLVRRKKRFLSLTRLVLHAENVNI